MLGTVGVTLLKGEEVEGDLAASLATAWISLGAAVDAHASTASLLEKDRFLSKNETMKH